MIPDPTLSHMMQDLVDRARISDVVTAYATGVDRRDWPLYRSIFADTVEFDFSSFNGEPARSWRADDWVAGVRETLGCFDATQHMMTNLAFTLGDEEATVAANMSALHYFAGDVQEMRGYYFNRLRRAGDGWKIFACRLMILWERGSRDLFVRAHERGAQSRIDVGVLGI